MPPSLNPATSAFDPSIILKSKEFKVLESDDQIAESDNIACCYNQHHQIHLARVPMPKAAKGQVVIKIRSCGICGSDVHFWKHGHIGDMVVTDECAAGHEAAGDVVQVGEGVTNLKVGDRVAIEAGVPCGACVTCLEGKYNACDNVVFFSTPPYHGLLTKFHAHPAMWAHKLPDSISYEEGALLEPLAVALAGLDRAELKLGDPLLICGAGPIGLVSLLAASAAGASPVVITDLSQSRLDFARKLCPRVVPVLIDPKADPQATASKIKEAAGMPLHVALECTGVEASIITAAYSLRFRSILHVIGLGQPVWKQFPFAHCSSQEIDLKFLFRYANQYPKAIRLVAAGLIDLKPLVTHRFPLERAVEAFETAADITKGSIKCQIIA